MAKRVSGPPRRPRNPVAKAVRTPAFRPRVVPDKRFRQNERQAEREAERPEREDSGDHDE